MDDQKRTPFRTPLPTGSDANKKRADRGIELISRAVNFEYHRNATATTAMSFVENTLRTSIFEAVHIDLIRGQINLLNEALWNSPEYILPRSVPIIRLGIIGSPESKRSELLKCFLGTSYITLNQGRGCRTKFPMVIGDREYLILCREESGAPAVDFIVWVDTLIIVSDGGDTTSTAEAYFKYFNEIRAASEVFVVLASIRYNKVQTMAFQPRFRCLCPAAPHVEVNLISKVNAGDPFRIACEGFEANRSRVQVPQTPSKFRTPASRNVGGARVDSTASVNFNPYASGTPQARKYSTRSASRHVPKFAPFETPNDSKPAPTTQSNVMPSNRTTRTDSKQEVCHPSWKQSRKTDASPFLQQVLKAKTPLADTAPRVVSTQRPRPNPRKLATYEDSAKNNPPVCSKTTVKPPPSSKVTTKASRKRTGMTASRPSKKLNTTIDLDSDDE